MLKQFIDRALGTWRTEEQAAGDAPEDRDGGSRRVDEPMANAASDQSTRVAVSRKIASVAAPSKYPLSWPARDLARTRRLQSRAETRAAREPKAEPGDEPDADPTVVWRPGDGHDGR